MGRHSACGLAVAAALSLASCAGGGASVSERTLTLGEIRDLTGLSAPVETAAQQQARQEDVFVRADSLILSTMRVEVAGPDGTLARRWLAACSGPSCDLHDPVTGRTETSSLATFEIVRGDAEVIGSAHAITLMSETTHHMGQESISLGAWMEHGHFGLYDDRVAGEEIEAAYSYALALGDLTNRPLTGSATWLGVMVGTPTAGDDRGDRLVGTAALNYDINAGGLDAAFSGIRNIDRGTVHGVEVVIFSNLAVGPDGTFATGQSGTRIQGGFYGPGHAEAAGIFEQSNIVGAFGATRQ
ncbi:MAG: hypothetical protein OXC10_06395 [Rhodospirillaceae bacterium]|nr:hypothetical protein [Rhodospirillaceae bacterium]